MTATPASRRGGHLPRRLSAAFWFAVPFVALAVIWAIAVELSGVERRIFPQVTDVASAFAEMWRSGDLFTHTGASLRRMGLGVIAALLTGIPFGVLLGSSRVAAAFFAPLLRFSVALAGIAWIPFATLWLGYGERAVVFIVWNAMFFALAYNTMLGVQRIPTQLIRAARSMGTPRHRMFVEVLLPGALPNIVTGLRVGLGYGWRGLVAAEIIAASAGLGYSIFLAQKYFRTDIIIAGMIIIGALWLVIDRALLAPLERRTVERWGMKAVNL
ncbi:ABC transporter permease [Phytoactinopolyspora halotolerans]|uniref:ABC transporter permease n=1 Tax=Phytoactinopolyspora halotolerans TaxID=1981512 RepID=A0A6L9SE74_9ACTN|nr:ABC transporter permease [Phytoactinopolyspora halotolerans]NEE02924.1 ABC transporter permease [Phytoactinopolyspora halotolerans]